MQSISIYIIIMQTCTYVLAAQGVRANVPSIYFKVQNRHTVHTCTIQTYRTYGTRLQNIELIWP
jgi:hypothetical protein